MNSKTNLSQSTKTEIPLHEQAFEWPRQAMQANNWREAAQRWEVLGKAYRNIPPHGFRGR